MMNSILYRENISHTAHNTIKCIAIQQSQFSIFFGGFPAPILRFFVVSIVCCQRLCIVAGMKNRNVSKCSSFHRTKSAFLSRCVCVSLTLIVFPFFYWPFESVFSIYNATNHFPSWTCLLSAFAFVRNIYHLMTFCLLFDSHSCSPARS